MNTFHYGSDKRRFSDIPRHAMLIHRLKDAITAADGLLLVTPEYNNSIPGVAKNAIDWFSGGAGTVSSRVFGGKAVVFGAPHQGSFVFEHPNIGEKMAAWKSFRLLGASVYGEASFLVSRAGQVIDANSGS